MPDRIMNEDLASVLPAGGLTYVSSCAAESDILHRAVQQAGEALGGMTFTGVFLPGLNRLNWLPNDRARVETFFMTPQLRAAGERVSFLPLSYTSILDRFQVSPPDAAMMMVSPPDEDGYCSLGVEIHFLGDIWPDIPVKIAHVNPSMPRPRGHRGVKYEELTAVIEAQRPILTNPDPEPDSAARAMATHVAQFIGDGATIQVGVGKAPAAILRAVTDRRKLRLHTGLIGDGLLALQASGALDETPDSSICGIVIGSSALYDALDRPNLSFQPVSVTHGVRRIAACRNFVAINSAMEVDLFGQAHAELSPTGLMSGPGGASDFARGAKLGGGLRIVTLAATAGRDGAISRIVAPGAGAGPVSLGRMDIDIVATEHGAADLRDLGHEARAQALIGVAAPQHREALERAWRDVAARF